MTNNHTDRPINFYKIDPEDWQSYVKKIFESVPGRTLAEKHEWLSSKLGVSPGTTAAWLNKGAGIPSTESQFATAELLKVPLSGMITQVQLRLDPPPLSSRAVTLEMIESISSIPESEFELIAKSLNSDTQAKSLYKAGSNLIQIANYL